MTTVLKTLRANTKEANSINEKNPEEVYHMEEKN